MHVRIDYRSRWVVELCTSNEPNAHGKELEKAGSYGEAERIAFGAVAGGQATHVVVTGNAARQEYRRNPDMHGYG